MAARPKYEYRLVCARYGERGHGTHAYRMPDEKAKREQKLIDANHHTEMLAARAVGNGKERSASYFGMEKPWRIQKREVGAWGEIE